MKLYRVLHQIEDGDNPPNKRLVHASTALYTDKESADKEMNEICLRIYREEEERARERAKRKCLNYAVAEVNVK